MNEKTNDHMKNHLADTLKKLSREKDFIAVIYAPFVILANHQKVEE